PKLNVRDQHAVFEDIPPYALTVPEFDFRNDPLREALERLDFIYANDCVQVSVRRVTPQWDDLLRRDFFKRQTPVLIVIDVKPSLAFINGLFPQILECPQERPVEYLIQPLLILLVRRLDRHRQSKQVTDLLINQLPHEVMN